MLINLLRASLVERLDYLDRVEKGRKVEKIMPKRHCHVLLLLALRSNLHYLRALKTLKSLTDCRKLMLCLLLYFYVAPTGA